MRKGDGDMKRRGICLLICLLLTAAAAAAETGGENMEEPLVLLQSYKKEGENNPLYTQRFGADPGVMEYNGRLYVYMTDDVRRIYAARKSAKGLSARECEVLARAGRGENNREIAAAMELSENTVKMFMKRAFFKLGATSRAEAVRLAGRRGLIPSE